MHLLFNQSSTGRVSGITYLFKDFKAKGQGLRNQFKWWGLIKHIPYDAERDNDSISEANKFTVAKFNLTLTGANAAFPDVKKADRTTVGTAQPDDAIQLLPEIIDRSIEPANGFYPMPNITISDDIDDEAIHGKRRRSRQRK